MTKSILAFAMSALVAGPVLAQKGGHEAHGGGGGAPAGGGGWGGHFNGGPPRGPSPSPVRAPAPRPVAAPHPVAAPRPANPVGVAVPRGEHGGEHGVEHGVEHVRPHVEHDGRWVGHDNGREDERYRFGKPWPHGHFGGPIGAGHVYRLGGWEAPAHRFWFGSSYFLVSPNDWGDADDWNWSADQVVLYDDPDHDGWYLAYNPRLGTYVHVEYDGALQP